jgi:hypothetical protein
MVSRSSLLAVAFVMAAAGCASSAARVATESANESAKKQELSPITKDAAIGFFDGLTAQTEEPVRHERLRRFLEVSAVDVVAAVGTAMPALVTSAELVGSRFARGVLAHEGDLRTLAREVGREMGEACTAALIATAGDGIERELGPDGDGRVSGALGAAMERVAAAGIRGAHRELSDAGSPGDPHFTPLERMSQAVASGVARELDHALPAKHALALTFGAGVAGGCVLALLVVAARRPRRRHVEPDEGAPPIPFRKVA